MRTLLIDNETRLIDQLQDLIPGNETVRRWNESYDDHDEFDIVILSGGSRFSVLGNEDVFAHEMKLITHRTKPLIGVCLGAEMIVQALDGTLRELEKKESGQCRIRVIEPLPLFGGMKEFSVKESHRYAIDVLPSSLEPLAESAHSMEMFRHRTLPFYGIQFHPESLKTKSDGRDIFLSLVREFGVF